MFQVADDRYVIRVWEPLVQHLQEKFQSLIKRAERLAAKAEGQPIKPPAIEILHEEILDINVNRQGDVRELRKRMYLEITAPVVKLADWEFAGTIEHAPVGNIMRMAGDRQAPDEFRTRDAVCDHCHTERRRTDTYLVYNANTDE